MSALQLNESVVTSSTITSGRPETIDAVKGPASFFGKGFPRYKVRQLHAFQCKPSNGYEETNQGMFGVGRALLARRIATIH